MILRPLSGVGWDELAAAFTEAFSDYAVPMTMTATALEAMQRRRGYVAARSVGAWDGDRLVGFVLTCADGARTYNSGTGVAPAYRRTGIARRLLDAVATAGPYVLEVLETNAKAIAFYASAGFVETRRFQCWTFGRAGAAVPETARDVQAIASDGDIEASWQNSVASIRRAPEPRVTLGDDAGAIVVFPTSADVPLLAVARAHRRHGLGTRLLEAAVARAGKPVRLLNVDDRATEVAAFLRAAGAEPTVRQLEMVR